MKVSSWLPPNFRDMVLLYMLPRRAPYILSLDPLLDGLFCFNRVFLIEFSKIQIACSFLAYEMYTKFLIVWQISIFFLLCQTVSVGRRKFSANFQLVFRLIKGMIFVTFVSILVILIALPHMTLQDIVVCVLAFMPTGWGILQVNFLSNSSLSNPWILFQRGVDILLNFLFYFILYICEGLELQSPIGRLYYIISHISSILKMLKS